MHDLAMENLEQLKEEANRIAVETERTVGRILTLRELIQEEEERDVES